MSRGSESWVEIIVGSLVGFYFLAVITGAIVGKISEYAHISFYLALAILAGIVVCGIFLIYGISSAWGWLERHKRCEHGIWAGSRGRCQICQSVAIRLQKQREADSLKWKQQKTIKEDAKRLREQEIERLSKAWLTNTEIYLEMDPQRFENAVAELFRSLGYNVKQTPFSNDGGKDAIAQKDGKKYLIECKRYGATKSIGRRDIQIFVAAMKDEKADGGFYINTGTFSRTARDYAAKNGIDIYDRLRLPLLVNQAYPVPIDISKADVMCLECGSVASLPVADTPVTETCVNGHSLTSNITKADLHIVSSTSAPYCDCGSPMRIVKGYRGQFWGCSRYPRCKRRKPFSPSMPSEILPPPDQPPKQEPQRSQLSPDAAKALGKLSPELAWLELQDQVAEAVSQHYEEAQKLADQLCVVEQLGPGWEDPLQTLQVVLGSFDPAWGVNTFEESNPDFNFQNISDQDPLKVLNAMFEMLLTNEKFAL